MTLDTNILIAYLVGEAVVVQTIHNWQRERRALFVSSVSTAELFAFSTLREYDVVKIRAFLKNFISVPLDDALAEPTALLRKMYHLPLPDSAIAATAWNRNVPLVTRDRQFRKIKEITVLEI